MRTYHIEIELPEGSDEFWEELHRVGKPRAKVLVRDEVAGALEGYCIFGAKVKVARVTDT